MSKSNLFSQSELPTLPIGFQHFKKFKPSTLIEEDTPPKTLHIKKYGTEYYRPSKFYKIISKFI